MSATSEALRVAIDSKDAAYLAESVDISETGVLVENYDGPKLRKGKKVRVIIQGVVADEDTDDDYSDMYVARVAGKRVAFTFCPYRPKKD